MSVVIVGAGPGVGRAVARRFAREGLPVVLISRRGWTTPLDVPSVALTADATDEQELRSVLDVAVDAFGVPEALVYNAALIRPDVPGGVSAADQLDAWSVNVVGALTAASHVAPQMAQRGRGSILFTGGMPRAKAAYTSLSLGKAGLRTLVDILDERFGGAGVHVGSVTIDGPVAPGTAFDPDDIAEHYWRLHTQASPEWSHEVLHSG